MTNPTAEDFEQARFAERPDALRHDAIWDAYSKTWRLGSGETIDVQRLAAGGWAPVHQADGSDRVAGRQKLLDHIASLDTVIRRRNDQIEQQESRIEQVDAALGHALSRLHGASESAPLSLDTLRTAWENADDWGLGDPIRKGDTVIVRNPDPEEFSVFTWPGYGYTPDEETRVLSRTQREPWVELAGVLHDEAPKGVVDVDHLAERLHAAGVRVTGGDET